MSTRILAAPVLLAFCLSGGCVSTARLVARLDENPAPAEKLRIAGRLGASRDPAAVAPLVELLSDPDYVLPPGGSSGEFGARIEYVSGRASRALVRLTGQDFRFNPFERPESRARAVRAWRAWYVSTEGRLWYDAHAGRLVARIEPEPKPEPTAPEKSGAEGVSHD